MTSASLPSRDGLASRPIREAEPLHGNHWGHGKLETHIPPQVPEDGRLTGAGLFGLTSYGLAVEPMWRLAVTRYRVTPANWPRGLKLKIGVIADVHAGGPACRPSASAASPSRPTSSSPTSSCCSAISPPATSSRPAPSRRRYGRRRWASSRAPLGVHAILGNHDWWDDLEAQRTRKGPVLGRRMLERVGIPVYENDVMRITHHGRAFWLAGLGDQIAFFERRRKGVGRRTFDGVDDLDGTLAKVTDDAPVILLAHEPDIFPRVPRRVSLTLSGHTHGGQVRMFGYSPMVPSRYGNRYAYGHIVEDDRHLIVSGGLGCSILPVRIGMPPEIVMVDVAAA